MSQLRHDVTRIPINRLVVELGSADIYVFRDQNTLDSCEFLLMSFAPESFQPRG